MYYTNDRDRQVHQRGTGQLQIGIACRVLTQRQRKQIKRALVSLRHSHHVVSLVRAEAHAWYVNVHHTHCTANCHGLIVWVHLLRGVWPSVVAVEKQVQRVRGPVHGDRAAVPVPARVLKSDERGVGLPIDPAVYPWHGLRTIIANIRIISHSFRIMLRTIRNVHVTGCVEEHT